MESSRKIFIDGIALDSIKDDQKLTNFFEDFDATVFQVAEEKFKEICEKSGVKASFTVIINFKED